MNYLRRYIETYHAITDEQYQHIMPYENNIKKIRKGHHIIKVGEISNVMGLIIEGVMVNSYFQRKEEKIKYFLFENEIAADPESFDFRKPSEMNIRAITDCRVLMMDYTTYRKLVSDFSWWADITRTIGCIFLSKKLQEKTDLMSLFGIQRYEKFLQTNEAIAKNVSLKMIACYLSIKPESLSRLRRLK